MKRYRKQRSIELYFLHQQQQPSAQPLSVSSPTVESSTQSITMTSLQKKYLADLPTKLLLKILADASMTSLLVSHKHAEVFDLSSIQTRLDSVISPFDPHSLLKPSY
jgi:hypothetical protein